MPTLKTITAAAVLLAAGGSGCADAADTEKMEFEVFVENHEVAADACARAMMTLPYSTAALTVPCKAIYARSYPSLFKSSEEYAQREGCDREDPGKETACLLPFFEQKGLADFFQRFVRATTKVLQAEDLARELAGD
jgi:hypothetical protein